MKTDIKVRGALRLTPCNYGISKLAFRGPMRPTEGRFTAFLGGSETFAKYIEKPFPELIETAIGEVCVNLGFQSAGPDVFLNDTAIQSLCHDADVAVIQILGAANLSNSFYKVHPRRNDRFIAPTEKLVALYPDVDFTEFAFTGHLIERLQAVDADRFAVVREHLQMTWVRRMKALIGKSGGPVLLLWFASYAPRNEARIGSDEPAFVTRDMLEVLRPFVADIVEVIGEHGQTEGMNFAPLEALTAKGALGVEAHVAAAKALRAPLLFGLG